MKKLLLTLGTVAAVAAPVASVIACGTTDPLKAREMAIIADFKDNTKYDFGDDTILKEFVGHFDSGGLDEHAIETFLKDAEKYKVENLKHNDTVTVDSNLDSVVAGDIVKASLTADYDFSKNRLYKTLVGIITDKIKGAKCIGRVELKTDTKPAEDVYYFNYPGGIDSGPARLVRQSQNTADNIYSYFSEGHDKSVTPNTEVLNKYDVKASVPSASSISDLSFMRTSDFSLTITKGDINSPEEVIMSFPALDGADAQGTAIGTISVSHAWQEMAIKWVKTTD